MKIGFNKIICSLPLAFALLLGSLIVYAQSKGIPLQNGELFIAVGLLVLSLPMFFVSYIVVTDTEIKINNEFGMPRRHAAITGLHDLKFENGNLMVLSNGEFVKLRFSKILVDPKGIKALKMKIDGVNN